MIDLLAELAEAQKAMLAAEARRDLAQRQLAEARLDVRAAYAARLAALQAATQPDNPESLVAAAAVMKVSLARVYQLLRRYPKSKPKG